MIPGIDVKHSQTNKYYHFVKVLHIKNIDENFAFSQETIIEGGKEWIISI